MEFPRDDLMASVPFRFNHEARGKLYKSFMTLWGDEIKTSIKSNQNSRQSENLVSCTNLSQTFHHFF